MQHASPLVALVAPLAVDQRGAMQVHEEAGLRPRSSVIREVLPIARPHRVAPHPIQEKHMSYFRELWHDIKAALSHFSYLRGHLRQGGNPDQASF